MIKMFKPLQLKYFAGIISLYTLLAFNIPLFQFAFSHLESSIVPKLLIIASLAVIMLAVNLMLTYLLVYLTRYVGKVLIGITFIINALAEYFVIVYKVMLDDTMLGNVFNTRYSEASGYFSWSMIVCIILFGILPALWIVLQPIKYGSKKQMVTMCGLSLGLALLLLVANIKQTLWISRYDTELGGLSMPWSYLVNSLRMIDMHNANSEVETLLPDGEIVDSTKTAVVLVIGESDRKANFQLYGYKRETNPMLSKQKDLVVLQAKSEATYTTAGTRAMLEPKREGQLYEILPNYAYRTGVDVEWRTSNWGEPPVHIGEKEYIGSEELRKQYPQFKGSDDGVLFAGIKQRIEKSSKNKVLIILHTSISHGPDYCLRVPEKFYKYMPILDNVEEAEKAPEKLINAYDNSILYTDYLLSNLIDTLRSMEQWQTAIIFASDHGESLGEGGIFMHGIPMSMAPKEQYEIPFLVWTSEKFRNVKKFTSPIDQHYIFHSVIDLLSIKSPAYQPENDIFE